MNKSGGWKAVAIIFIILFILSWVFILTIMKIGYDEIRDEEECMNIICEEYDFYYYADGLCSCYRGNETLTVWVDSG